MKSPEKPEYCSDDNLDEINKKFTSNSKTDKKKKSKKILIDVQKEKENQQIAHIPFEEQETIDFVLMDFKSPKELINFKNMKNLSLIQQNINSIKVFSNCQSSIPKLESLNLNENSIESLEYIENFSNLIDLQINFNQIKKIEYINKLTKLEKFWICENKIKSVENLPPNLKNFWVALNFVEKLDQNSFINSKNIIELNISGNFLSSLKDFSIISQLENLKILNLYDPNFGENPICLINNYRLYIFNKFEKLEILDEICLNKEEIQENRNIIIKKNNYYKNRIKQMNRISRSCFKMLKNFNFFYKHLKLLQIFNMKSRIKSLEYLKYEKMINNLNNKSEKKGEDNIKNLTNINFTESNNKEDLNKISISNTESNFDKFNNNHINTDVNVTKRKYSDDRFSKKEKLADELNLNLNLNSKEKDRKLIQEIDNDIKSLNSKINKAIENMRTCDFNYKEIKNLISEINDFYIVSNFYELESFGNIKLESGFICDKWASSCMDLIKNRLTNSFLNEYDIRKINVLRIWKTTFKLNRVLYDNNYEMFLDQFNKFGEDTKYYDYLFMYCNGQNLQDIVQNVFEDFHSNDIKKSQEKNEEDKFYIFTTHLDKSEFAKLGNKNNQNQYKNERYYTVICKCIMMDEIIHKSHSNYNEEFSNNSKKNPFEDIIEIAKNHNFNSSKNILEISNSAKDKKIFVIKNRFFFIPEYIIEYNYLYNNKKNKGNNIDNNMMNNMMNNTNSNNNILLSSYNFLKEAKATDFNNEFIRNFNSSLKSLLNSEVQIFSNKKNIMKNSFCNFQLFPEFDSNEIFFAKYSIYNYISHCYKFLNKENFSVEFNKIKDNLNSIKRSPIKNPLLIFENNNKEKDESNSNINLNTKEDFGLNNHPAHKKIFKDFIAEDFFEKKDPKESTRKSMKEKHKRDKSSIGLKTSNAIDTEEVILEPLTNKFSFDVCLFEKLNLTSLNLFNSKITDENLNMIITNFRENYQIAKNLSSLSLSHNRIKNIDLIEILMILKNLKQFDISHNYLKTINFKKSFDKNSDEKVFDFSEESKLEFFDFSYNNISEFSEVMSIINFVNNKENKNFNFFLKNLFIISFISNSFIQKIVNYFSYNNINTLQFIINKKIFEEILRNFADEKKSSNNNNQKITNLKDDYILSIIDNINLNISYLDDIEKFTNDLNQIIEDENYDKINSEENNKEKRLNTTISTFPNDNNNKQNNSKMVLDSEIAKYSLKENLKMFNLIYETYSFTKNYRNFDEKNIFTIKVEIEKFSKVLILSKMKLRYVPIIKIPEKETNKEKNSKNTNGNYLNLNCVKTLYLNLNKISNLQNLIQFGDLHELYLQSNKIKNLPLIEMPNLKKLDLSNNHIKTLTGISGMKNLQNLLLENNLIKSLSSNELFLLKNLKEFNISGNSIEILKECISLKKLDTLQNLDFSGNDVSNYSDFRIFMIYYIPNLKILNRYPVEKNEVIKANEFFDGRITSELLENRLGHCQTKSVKELDLSNNKLKSFERIFNVENFPNLKKLDLSRNLFSSFKIFGNLPSLTTLYLNLNVFYSIIDLKDKTNSTKGLYGIPILEMNENNLNDLSGVQILKNLKSLILRKNNIPRIDAVDEILNLNFLDISFNKMRNIERNNLGILPSLKTLICDGNFLKNVNAFSKLQSLNYLSLENNKISETTNLEKLSFLENLVDLNISNNPICKISGYRSNTVKKFMYLAKLDKLEITREERENAFIDQANCSGYLNNNETVINNFNNIAFNATKSDQKKSGMKVNFINLDINNSNNNYLKQSNNNGFEDLIIAGNNMNINMINNINFNMNLMGNTTQQKPNFRSQSLSVQHLLDLNQNMGNLPLINALSINGNVQNNEKNQIINNYEENDLLSPNYRVKKTYNNRNKASSVGKTNKSNGAIPLKSLLKSIGEAISQNQGNPNLMNKMPSNQINKNSTMRLTKK